MQLRFKTEEGYLIKPMTKRVIKEAWDSLPSEIAIIDVETTGLSTDHDEIIQISIKTKDDSLTYFNQPKVPITKEIVELTGITPEMVKGKKPDWKSIQYLMKGKKIIAHNASFDRPFVHRHISTEGQNWYCSCDSIDWRGRKHASAALESLVRDHGYYYEAHRADVDVDAVAILLSAFDNLELMKQSKYSGSGIYIYGKPDYDDKDIVKGWGLKWHPGRKQWHGFIFEDEEYEDFNRLMPFFNRKSIQIPKALGLLSEV